MFRSSPPISDDEATDNEMPLLEGAQDEPSTSNNNQPANTTHPNAISVPPSDMDCLHSITDPLRAYFSPTAPHKPRSKSHGDAEFPQLRTEFGRLSVDLPRNPPPTPRISDDGAEDRARGIKEVRERQQAEYLRAIATKREDQHCRGQQEGFPKRLEKETQRGEQVDIGTLGQSQLGGAARRHAMESHSEFMETLLTPVSAELVRLKHTTSPPYNPRLNVKSAPEVLKDRVLPIGRHILRLLQKEQVERRGEREISICRYIAEKYWPNEIVEKDYLGIMEMYRNAVFLEELGMRRRTGSEETEVVKGG